jgi:sulfatase maturation enzyme AslB (radical SAM superfamily)
MLYDPKKDGKTVTWECAAIDHGITVYPNRKIGPCCQISSSYLKPISEIENPLRFADLKTEHPPSACEICVKAEANHLPSYRTFFNTAKKSVPGIQFLDIRNTNLCNLKCRYCGPHFSSQWGEELGYMPAIKHTSFEEHKDFLISDSLSSIYFTGGEPLINADHWNLLQELIDTDRSKNIKLMYNSNLTTIKYKDRNISEIWQQFQAVNVNCSIDAVGKPLEYIRSGSNWEKIKNNLTQLKNMDKVKIYFTPVVSILNLWFLKDLFVFAQHENIQVNLTILHGPDYLALDVIPDQHKAQALDVVKDIESQFNIDKNFLDRIKNLIENNQNQYLFQHALSHILLLDQLRDEKLFDLLPFKSTAIETFLKNYEYE